jgi:phage terminase large subunit-like protein
MQYALDVRAGKIVAGGPVRQACERHIQDHKNQKVTGLHYFKDHAAWAISIFEQELTVEKHEQMTAFHLEPFEAFIVGSIFGWYNSDGTRRFRTAYIEIGKGNGKTVLAAGIGVIGLRYDGQTSAEIYAAATTREQAQVCWKDALAMVRRTPNLHREIEDRVASLYYAPTNSVFRPVSSEHKGLDGKRVHMALVDELHEHPNSLVVDKMRAGTKNRRNALIFEITNSGSELETVCWNHHDYSLRILNGTAEDPGWFAYVCALDEGDDWMDDESCWIKANPGLGTILPIEYLREQVREAKGMPSKQNIVKRLNFSIWTQQHTVWLDLKEWDSCGGIVPLTAIEQEPCWLGLDLSSKIDLTSLAVLFRRDLGEDLAIEVPDGQDAKGEVKKRTLNLNYAVDLLPYFYMPEETLFARAKTDRVPYPLWLQQGHIRATPGNIIDYDFIYDQIVNEIAPHYSIQEIGFDPYNATQFSLSLAAAGFSVVDVRQGVQTMSEPSKVFEALLKAGRIRHGAHPVLRWCASNVAAKEDKKGNIFPYKQHERKRIDGVIAAIIGLSRLIVSDPESSQSVYDNRPSFLQL